MPILKPLNKEGIPFYRSAIIVRNDSALQSITEIKGKTMAFGSPHSTSGNLIPRYLLWDNKVRMQDLKSFTNLQHHDAVAKAILKGQFDAGAVKDVVAEKYKPHGLRILAWSKPIPAVPLVVRRDTPPEVVQAITRALLKLDRTNPRHKAIMKNGMMSSTTVLHSPSAGLCRHLPYDPRYSNRVRRRVPQMTTRRLSVSRHSLC